jgi:lysophospholipid acyltransferase (LPLAT)-like uncharacterized protein
MVADASKPVKRNAKSGVVVPHTPTWLQRAGAWTIYIAMRALMATLRYRWSNESVLRGGSPPSPAIYCIWHNRLLLSMQAHSYVRKFSNAAGLAAMVSASRDGGFLSAILEQFRVQPVRGSSSRRGPRALLELTTWAERGYDLAITPDGPRGPCYVVQEGVMVLAQLTGLPIVPFSYEAQWKLRVKSWDRFQIPLPFSRCNMKFGQPVHVPREATDDEREQLRRHLEQTLRELSRD